MKIKALTLVETLTAIMVFGIGILTVLFGLSQTLRNQDYANTQIKAAFFAREGIELIFNLRDANYHKELPWNCIFTPIKELESSYQEDENPYCEKLFKPGTVLKINIDSEDKYINMEASNDIKDFDSMFNDYQIYFHTGNVINSNIGFIYNHNGTEDEKTGFARYLTITGVVDENGDLIDSNELLKIESHVLYKKGALTGEKIMETFMGDYEF